MEAGLWTFVALAARTGNESVSVWASIVANEERELEGLGEPNVLDRKPRLARRHDAWIGVRS